MAKIDNLLKEYKVLETIGQGSFGKVKRAISRISSQPVAIKVIEKRLIDNVEVCFMCLGLMV